MFARTRRDLPLRDARGRALPIEPPFECAEALGRKAATDARRRGVIESARDARRPILSRDDRPIAAFERSSQRTHALERAPPLLRNVHGRRRRRGQRKIGHLIGEMPILEYDRQP